MKNMIIKKFSDSASFIFIMWTIIFTIELIFIFVLDGTSIHNSRIPLFFRINVLFRHVLLSLLTFMIIGVPAHLLAVVIINTYPRLNKVIFFFGSIFLFLTIFSLSTSWYFFISNGSFLGVEGIRFFVNDSLQVVEHALHMAPFLLTQFLLAILILSGFFLFICLKITRAQYFNSHKITTLSLSLLIFSFVAMLFTGSISRSQFKDNIENRSIYNKLLLLLEHKTSPIMQLRSDYYFYKSHSYTLRSKNSYYKIEYKPLIDIKAYLRRVNRERLKKYNVIVMLIESLRSDQLTHFSGNRTVMPNLEKLSEKSLRLTNAYTQSSHSSYSDICPLSSHYPLRSVYTHYYPKNPSYPRVLIYDILKQLGYRTAIVSSQNENWGNMYNYLNTGNVDHFFHSGNYSGHTYVNRSDTGFAKWLKGEQKRSGKIDDKITIDEATNWIDKNTTSPFFMYINLQNSHIPYEIPDDFKRRFSKPEWNIPIRFGYFPKYEKKRVIDTYSDSLAYIDEQIGILLEYLKKKDLLKNTLIVASADTGQAFYEHGFAHHASYLYNEVVKVPIVIYASDLEPRVIKVPVQHIDIPPTILSILGLPPHPSFQGRDIIDKPSSDRSVFLVCQTSLAYQFAIVYHGYKLLYSPNEEIYHLYDLKKDPLETTDLSKSRPKAFSELRDRLMAWITEQINYYRSPNIHKRYYPPRYIELEKK